MGAFPNAAPQRQLRAARWTRRSLASNLLGPSSPRKIQKIGSNLQIVLLWRLGADLFKETRLAGLEPWPHRRNILATSIELHRTPFMQLRLALDSKRQALKAKTRICEWEKKSTIGIRKNPKPVEAEAGVERRRGWAPASRGAFSTSAPPH